MKRIRKAIFPVAGLGTRFLPATKATPKEMLPIVDKPLIQFAVEEAIEAGLTDMIFVTGRTKRAIEDHFDKAYELETELAAKAKHDLLAVVQSVLPKGISCVYIRQAEPLGLGHAVGCARDVVDDEPFAVVLADDLIDAAPGALKQMVDCAHRHNGSVLGVEDVPRARTRQYGIVSATPVAGRTERVAAIVEKPDPAVAPSTLAVVGRYILSPRVFALIDQVTPGAGGELQLTDAISALLAEEPVFAHRFAGVRYDCGSKLGYMKAMVEFGSKHHEIGAEFAAYLAQRGR
ncbi:MAG: UTP--glucose-1-phosphate uridylyltransferase GalU [Burkholderiales bacterium]|nr:UTP--glucose-1-phosphate uridylyltransferase GalU [Burkholderiales bacterium]